MSLLNCYNCDKEISDKSYKCPHCGFVATTRDDAKRYISLYKASTYSEIRDIIVVMLVDRYDPTRLMNTIVYKRIVEQHNQPERFNVLRQIVNVSMSKWHKRIRRKAQLKNPGGIRIAWTDSIANRYAQKKPKKNGNHIKTIYTKTNICKPYQGGRTSGK